ncbi:MAG: hypothetical protein PUK73_01930 [Spirochaetota bacterium]|uniref:hypothetical protein n=1 Tax=Candidatus Avelusimicrobium faecicola TaxID=3416205 RepID=UPI00205F7401|nr:hypothetical protein [Spirochaetota bacterium]DAY83263.1 MAG TPA: SULFITE REDUCTASE ALPHA SUBUNIT [Caudoviricetes sp.]
MTKDKEKNMPEIIQHEVKDENKQVVEVRKYYTAKGLAVRLPGRKRGGGMNISTVYELIGQGMPGVVKIAGVRLLPVGKLSEVMDWLEQRKQQ